MDNFVPDAISTDELIDISAFNSMPQELKTASFEQLLQQSQAEVADMLSRARDLVKDVDIDPDAPLDPEDE